MFIVLLIDEFSFQCWDLRSKRMQPVQTLEETGDTVTSVDVTSYEILVGSADAKVRRYDLRNGFLVTDLVGQNPVTSVAVSADSASVLVNLCQGEPLRLFDKSSGELLQEFQGHSHPSNIRIDAVLDDGNQNVLCGSEDGFVYVWDLLEAGVKSKLAHSQDGARVSVTSLSHHHEQPRLVTAARADLFFWEKQKE